MALTQRTMPVREDHWQPEDHIFQGVLDRCAAEVQDAEARDGTAEMMAGALILAVLFVVILAGAHSANAAVLICGLLAGAGFLYMVNSSRTARVDRSTALKSLGGPGRLPAGYLVHPSAWKAGMAEHVAVVPESQLRAAAELCNIFPGTVDDLFTFVGNLAIHVPVTRHQTAADVQRRAHELVRIGRPILVDYAKSAPPLPVPPPPGGRKGKRK